MIASSAIICPLSPPTPPSEIIRDEDLGWAELGDAPIRVEEQSAAQAARDAGADDVVDGHDEREAQMPRGMPPPPEPSAAEIARTIPTARGALTALPAGGPIPNIAVIGPHAE